LIVAHPEQSVSSEGEPVLSQVPAPSKKVTTQVPIVILSEFAGRVQTVSVCDAFVSGVPASFGVGVAETFV